MPNIFDGISKLNDVDLRSQIATLEEVTMTNVFGQMGNQISNKAATAFGFVKKKITGKDTEVKPVIKIEDKINKKIEVLSSLDRDELDTRIRKVLKEKINSATGQTLENPSDDLLSVEIIDLAVKNFKNEKIDENLTYAQKADVIRHRYDEKMLTQMQKELNKQTEEKKRETEEAIQKELDSMSEERREELRKALNIEELNGQMVRKMFASTAGVSAALIAMETAGFGAYIALTTIMHAIFTTFLGITLPFAAYTGATSFLSFITGPAGILLFGGIELLMVNKNKNKLIYELAAQIVWLSVSTYGHKFTPNEEELPSWLPSMERDRESVEINDLHEMLRAEEELKKELEKNKKDLDIAQKTIQSNEEAIKKYKSASENAKQKLDMQLSENEKLKADHERAVVQLDYLRNSSKVTEEELYKAKSDVNRLERSISSKDREISELYEVLRMDDNKISDLEKINTESQNTIEVKNTEIERLRQEVDSSNKKTEKKLVKNSEDLKRRWIKFFKTLDFDTTVFKDVVKNFEFNEFTEIEIKLREIDDAKDKRAVRDNRGKVSDGRCHVGFSTQSGYPSRIFYKEIKNATDGKTVLITDIVKHNDPRYKSLC